MLKKCIRQLKIKSIILFNRGIIAGGYIFKRQFVKNSDLAHKILSKIFPVIIFVKKLDVFLKKHMLIRNFLF